MSFFKTLILLFSLSAYVSALATSHIHGVHHRRTLAARSPISGAGSSLAHVSRRNLSKRCKDRVNHPSSSAVPTPTPPVNVAPEPTTTKKPAETHAPPPPPAPAPPPPAPAPPQNGGGGGDAHNGQGTFYSTGLGACVTTNNDGDFIAAASHALFDSFPGANGNPNQNPICNKRVTVHRNGKTISVIITDRCEACAFFDLDFSPSAFNVIASPSEGRVPITWTWD